MDYYSPLRYPGGKGRVADYFKKIIKDNLLYDAVYVEPYAGGSSVALSLLVNEYASKILINDKDLSIYAFWHSILNNTDELCKLIIDTPVNVKNWDKQKLVQRERWRYGLLKIGFSTFFLNRTNRSGILNAGIIGGKDQSGPWKIDARFNKVDLVKRIQRIALYRSKISLFNEDAMRLIKRLSKGLPKNTIYYFDPPYYVKGQDLYLNHYKESDHKSIADEIFKLNQPHSWIVTYDNVPEIRHLYKDYRQRKFTLNYSASSHSKGQEVMIFSDNVYISKVPILKAM